MNNFCQVFARKNLLPNFLPGWHEVWQNHFNVSFILQSWLRMFLECEKPMTLHILSPLHTSLHIANELNGIAHVKLFTFPLSILPYSRAGFAYMEVSKCFRVTNTFTEGALRNGNFCSVILDFCHLFSCKKTIF